VGIEDGLIPIFACVTYTVLVVLPNRLPLPINRGSYLSAISGVGNMGTLAVLSAGLTLPLTDTGGHGSKSSLSRPYLGAGGYRKSFQIHPEPDSMT